MNTYDNTILYTDSMVSKTIDALKARQANMNTALIYLSDHGESLGESGIICTARRTCWRRSSRRTFRLCSGCPRTMRKLWHQRAVFTRPRSKNAVSQDNLFSTVLGMMDVKSSVYQQQLDILNACRR